MVLVGDVPACQRCPALGAPADSRHCWGTGIGQGEARTRWNFRRSLLNSAQQQSLWDIHPSLALSRLALEVLLRHQAQRVSGQWRGEGSWSLKPMKCGCREQHHQKQEEQLTGEANVTLPAGFSGLGPTTSRSPPSGPLSKDVRDFLQIRQKGHLLPLLKLSRKVGIMMYCRG